VGIYVCGIGDEGNENVGIGWIVKEVDGVSGFIVRKPFLEMGKVFFRGGRPVECTIWFEGFWYQWEGSAEKESTSLDGDFDGTVGRRRGGFVEGGYEGGGD
jgi:hypothetical protein